MKKEEIILLGVLAIFFVFFGIKLALEDFHFIDALMVIPFIALPLAVTLHFLGRAIQKFIKYIPEHSFFKHIVISGG